MELQLHFERRNDSVLGVISKCAVLSISLPRSSSLSDSSSIVEASCVDISQLIHRDCDRLDILLSNKNLTDSDLLSSLKCLSELSRDVNIQRVDLSGNRLTDVSVPEIGSLIMSFCPQEVSLSTNLFTANGACKLLRAVQESGKYPSRSAAGLQSPIWLCFDRNRINLEEFWANVTTDLGGVLICTADNDDCSPAQCHAYPCPLIHLSDMHIQNHEEGTLSAIALLQFFRTFQSRFEFTKNPVLTGILNDLRNSCARDPSLIVAPTQPCGHEYIAGQIRLYEIVICNSRVLKTCGLELEHVPEGYYVRDINSACHQESIGCGDIITNISNHELQGKSIDEIRLLFRANLYDGAPVHLKKSVRQSKDDPHEQLLRQFTFFGGLNLNVAVFSNLEKIKCFVDERGGFSLIAQRVHLESVHELILT